MCWAQAVLHILSLHITNHQLIMSCWNCSVIYVQYSKQESRIRRGRKGDLQGSIQDPRVRRRSTYVCILFLPSIFHDLHTWNWSNVWLSWGFVPPFKGFFGWSFSSSTIEGVVCCTCSKAPRGKLWFVILGCINKIDLTWLDLSFCLCILG